MNNKRLLSLLLSLAMLLMTCMPMPVFAEGEIVEEIAVEEIAEKPVEEIAEDPAAEPTEEPAEDPAVEPTEEPAEDPVVEPTEEPAEDPAVEPTEEPAEAPLAEPTEEPAEDPVAEPTEEPAEVPVAEPEFVPGYVAYDADTEIYESNRLNGEPVVLAEDGVVYAYEEADEGVYGVYYVVEADEIEVGYIDGEGDALTEEEIEDYIKTIEKDAKAVTAEIPGVEDGVLVAIELVVEEIIPEEEEPAADSAPVEDEEQVTEPSAQTEGIQITKQPENQIVPAGAEAVFTVEATGTGLSYQWQAKAASATNWNNSSGNNGSGKTASLSLTAKTYQDGYMFRCKITDGSGNVAYTDVVTLTIGTAPVIAAQPVSVEVTAGETAIFAVEASADTELTYQWQVKTGAAATEWTDIAEATAATYEIAAAEEMNGYVYRVVVTSAQGLSTTSEEATLTVNAAVTEIVADDVTYTITGETTVEVKSYAGSASSVTIPQTVEGYTVTAIGESAFEGNTALTTIDLPDTIEVIGKRAFANCTSLTTMN